MVSMDSCLAVSMKLEGLTTMIAASSGWAVRRAPARSSRPIMTSESTRFLGQPSEIKPTEGAVGAESLVTLLLYRWFGCGDSTSADAETSKRVSVYRMQQVSPAARDSRASKLAIWQDWVAARDSRASKLAIWQDWV